MKTRTPHTGGEPVQGEKTDYFYYTLLLPYLQVFEGHLLLILIFVERLVREVVR